MGKNAPSKMFANIKNLLVYQPSRSPDPFVLDETQEDKSKADGEPPSIPLPERAREMELMLNCAKRLTVFAEGLAEHLQSKQRPEAFEKIKSDFGKIETEWAEIKKNTLEQHHSDGMYSNVAISTDLEENQKTIESLYNLPLNKDIVIRKMTISNQPKVEVLLVFMDGLIDNKVITLTILQPFMSMKNIQEAVESEDFIGFVMGQCLPNGQTGRVKSFKEVQQAINTGDTVLFFDGSHEAITVESKGYEHRSIGRPTTEQSVRGSQHAFTEAIRVNTALIRTMLHATDLVTEMIPVGARGHNNCAVMYLKSVANPELVAEVRRRIKNINVDLIIDSGVLEHFITDSPKNPFPQTLSTERPDRMVAHLAEGRVGILLDGNPFVHIVPVSIFTLMHSADDFSLNLYYSNVLRIIRWAGGFVSMLLPAMYLAVSTFHQEAIPTELMLSITAARGQVPFPTIVEILLMEFSFELIREGGLRIPGILGSTLGIVGAIILGQAAVTAKIVSPIMVIVVAVTGLASYSIPDYRLGSAFRLFRVLFLLMSAAMGLVGIACGFLILTAILCSMKSFGMPYLAPLAPKTTPGGDVILRKAAYVQEGRPDELNTQDRIRQDTISRPWIEETPAGGKHS